MQQPFYSMKSIDNVPDEQLVLLAQQGDTETEEYLIRKYKELVKNRAHLYFIAGADREDIVQEGMIGVFRAIRSYDASKEASFRTFADLCINRQIISAIKTATRLKHSPLNSSISLNKPMQDEMTSTLEELLQSDSDSDPEALLVLKEQFHYLENRENGVLSPLERQVWIGHMQGKSYQKIAEETGRPPKSIDNAIQRTKKKLELYLGRG